MLQFFAHQFKGSLSKQAEQNTRVTEVNKGPIQGQTRLPLSQAWVWGLCSAPGPPEARTEAPRCQTQKDQLHKVPFIPQSWFPQGEAQEGVLNGCRRPYLHLPGPHVLHRGWLAGLMHNEKLFSQGGGADIIEGEDLHSELPFPGKQDARSEPLPSKVNAHNGATVNCLPCRVKCTQWGHGEPPALQGEHTPWRGESATHQPAFSFVTIPQLCN